MASSVAFSSLYNRSASRPRDFHPSSRPAVQAPCPSQLPVRSAPQTAVRDLLSRQHQVTGSTRPCNNGGPSVPCTADRNSSVGKGNEHRSTANNAYDSCITAITRQQVDSIMHARCHRPHRPAAATARSIRQNPTVV